MTTTYDGDTDLHPSGRFVFSRDEETGFCYLNDLKTGICYDLTVLPYAEGYEDARQEAAALFAA